MRFEFQSLGFFLAHSGQQRQVSPKVPPGKRVITGLLGSVQPFDRFVGMRQCLYRLIRVRQCFRGFVDMLRHSDSIVEVRRNVHRIVGVHRCVHHRPATGDHRQRQRDDIRR